MVEYDVAEHDDSGMSRILDVECRPHGKDGFHLNQKK